MTLQEFEQERTGIVQQTFNGNFADPVQYGIQRGQFERDKLQKLIDLGKNVRSKTVQAKVVLWKREVARINARMTRLQQLKEEIQASRLRIGLKSTGKKENPIIRTRRPRFE